ncbi:hypothetical protein ACFWPV_26250 [Streptomyces uncialis]|uniref:hypothetical protein n=1 Tax=Streptomyces uncialis TaxID=1048205 RepID=UPI003669CB8C
MREEHPARTFPGRTVAPLGVSGAASGCGCDPVSGLLRGRVVHLVCDPYGRAVAVGRVTELEHQILDLHAELAEQNEGITAARAANRDLMARSTDIGVAPVARGAF